MADPRTGTFEWRRKGKNSPFFSMMRYKSAKGKDVNKTNIAAESVHPELQQPFEGERDVWYDFALNNEPIRIRPVGVKWEAAEESLAGVDFHNPYLFAPAPTPTTSKRFLDSAFGHRAPTGHDHYAPDKFSGTLTLQIKAETPLLLPDAATQERDDTGHVTQKTLRDPRNQTLPLLRPTALKGALRSAFETITNSRFGVFPERAHEAPLARRMAAGEALAMIPARVSDDGRRLELWMGIQTQADWKKRAPEINKANGKYRPVNPAYAAWLRQYDKRGHRGRGASYGPCYDRDAVRYQDGSYPQHRDPVVCWLEKDNAIYRVIALEHADRADSLPTEAQIGAAGRDLIRAYGYVSVTGQNIGLKQNERVFFVLDGDAPAELPLVSLWKTRYEQLIKDYQAIHQRDIEKRRPAPPDAYLGPNINETAFSRHVFTPEDAKLKPGDLVYARVDKNRAITGLYPVIIARELASKSPGGLLPPDLRPAEDYAQLSPADRVFGWVNPKGGASNNKRKAHRGQLRIRDVRCVDGEVQTFDTPLPLAILSTPKPNQAQFYAAGDTLGAPLNQGTYDDAKALRGRKLYPHHASLPDNYWDLTSFAQDTCGNRPREFVRKGGTKDDQNRSIKDWVEPGTVFTAEIDMINLSEAELSALVWLCAMPEAHYLRLGGGKPLGFGSVRVTISAMDMRDGAAKQAEYAALRSSNRNNNIGETRDGDSAQILAQRFEELMADAWGGADVNDIPFVARFKAAAKGYSPIHYPRMGRQPDPEGKNYEWFEVKNLQPLPLHGGLKYRAGR